MSKQVTITGPRGQQVRVMDSSLRFWQLRGWRVETGVAVEPDVTLGEGDDSVLATPVSMPESELPSSPNLGEKGTKPSKTTRSRP